MTMHSGIRQVRDRLAGRSGPVRFEALDSWRGLAAVMVVLFHAQIVSHVYDSRLVVAGDAFVDFFFVLSGFVIAHAYGSKLTSGEGLGRFLFLRVGRLYPLHLFMLGLFVAFEVARLALPFLTRGGEPAFGEGNSLPALAANLLMLQAFHPIDHLSWNAPSWSISAELLAYATFGLLALAAPKRMNLWLAASALASLLVLAFFSARGMETAAGLGWPRAVLGFALGALLHRLAGNRVLALKRAGGLRPSPAWTALEALAALGVCLAAAFFHGTLFAYALPLLFAAAVGIFAVERGRLSLWLKWRPFALLGAISYSIYLTHLFVLSRLINAARLSERVFDLPLLHDVGTAARGGLGIDAGSLWAGDLLVALVLACVVAMSWLTWRFVELPGQALFRRWSDRLFVRRAPVPAGLAQAR